MKIHTEIVKIGRNFFVLCAICFSCISIALADSNEVPLVRSYFNNEKIQKNSIVTYVIEITNGTLSGNIALPNVDGILVQGVSTQKEISSVNWQTVQKLCYIFRMQATAEGEIEIPSFDIIVNNEKMTVPPAKLTVTNNPVDPVETAKSLVFLTVDTPNREIFVGELIKTKINVFVAEGVKASFLCNRPYKNSEDFAEKAIGDPEEQPSFCIIGNKNYRKFSWDVVLLPLKSGIDSLQYSMDVAVWSNDKIKSNSDVVGMFQSFDDIFEKMLLSRKVEFSVKNPTLDLNVLSLPIDSTVSDFTGAIGHFEIENVDVSSSQATIGEPIILKIIVSGTGNFGAKEPILAASDLWQIHSPKSHFEQSDNIGISGKKIFEYVLIPQKTGVLKLPPDVRMTFFDDLEKNFVTLTKPITGEVIIARSEKSNVVSENLSDKLNIVDKNKENTVLCLTPLKVNVGDVSKTFTPITHSYVFWLANLSILAFLIIKIVRRKMFIKINGDKNFAKIRAARLRFGKALVNMERAAEYKDVVNFFAFAQYAIRECLAAKQGAVGASMTFEDIAEIMRHKNINEELFEKIRVIYSRGDEIRFGSMKFDDAENDLVELLSDYKKVITSLRDCAKEIK